MRLSGFAILIALLPVPAAAVQDVANTVHNLSASGPGLIKSLTIEEVCVFCHTPHSPEPVAPLWNHQMSGQTYIEYGSSTLRASPGQPTGKSRLCLGCHDGTVALGAFVNPPDNVINDLTSTYLTSRANLGTDLSDDHPISFPYDTALQAANPKLVHPSGIDLPLEQGALQCTTCHDAHERDLIPFLRRTTANGELCLSCHRQAGANWSWSGSAHALSPATAAGANPWSERKPEWRALNVAGNACFNCHMPHNAVTPERLIKNIEEDTCYLCHDGGTARTDIRSETLKTSRHPADLYTGVHDPVEDVTASPPAHVECADCHNPHASNDSAAAAPTVPGPVQSVSGISIGGAPVEEASVLYEVCFKCHADNNVMTSPVVTRLINELNTRLEFDSGNPSHHAVAAPGRNPDVPSLRAPLTTDSVIYCTDCHANNDGAQAGGSGPDGPHGSIYRPLLERNLTTADNTQESLQAYDLCYKCHDRSSILNDTTFKEHDKHIRGERSPCTACHDPHGVSATRGNSTNNSHLINFDLSIVSPNRSGDGPRFEDLGSRRGRCYLSCHGENHNPESYP